MKIHFRILEEKDFPQMHVWLNTDFVKQFFKNPSTMDDIKKEYEPYITGEDPTTPYIIMIDGVDIGYIQTYYYSDYCDNYYEELNADKYSAGVDLFIGHKDYIHKGYGTHIMQAFIKKYVFINPKTVNVIITPEPGNLIAIKVYEKVGFRWYKTIKTPKGEFEYLMSLSRENFNVRSENKMKYLFEGNYINPPTQSPQNVSHKTFYSELFGHEIGYNIYIPTEYEKSGERYPVAYHFHGWTGNESSDIWTMEKVYSNRQSITVFPNNSPVIEDMENLPVESMIINELIPHIDGNYRTHTARESRSVSGFSMGGGMAFYYAVKYPEVFGSVTAYAGTYHHYYHKEYSGVGEPPEKAVELYENMMGEERYLEENNVLYVIRENAEKIRNNLHIKIHVGTADILFCDNEILHLYLNSLNIPHEYKKFDGVAHELDKII